MNLKIERVEVFGVAMQKLDLSSGSIALRPGPGYGVTLDDAKLAKYRFEIKAAA